MRARADKGDMLSAGLSSGCCSSLVCHGHLSQQAQPALWTSILETVGGDRYTPGPHHSATSGPTSSECRASPRGNKQLWPETFPEVTGSLEVAPAVTTLNPAQVEVVPDPLWCPPVTDPDGEIRTGGPDFPTLPGTSRGLGCGWSWACRASALWPWQPGRHVLLWG